MVVSGQPDEGVAELERGLTLYQGLSTPPVFWPALLLIRATAYGAAGRLDEAMGFIAEAEQAVHDDDPLRADMAIAHGDLLLLPTEPDLALAEEHFERAAALARERGARMVELQAATRLATTRRGTPREAEARAALRDIVDSFTEGFDEPQFVAARAALDDR